MRYYVTLTYELTHTTVLEEADAKTAADECRSMAVLDHALEPENSKLKKVSVISKTDVFDLDPED